ncbi:hypothetical protein P355_1616 [Burkholderia cenocepacia KC-01]|nr:hypothetical protein P355_1616 [Burkholderia cenocepacia KC-01]
MDRDPFRGAAAGLAPGQPKRNDGGTALPHLHPVRTNA